MEVRRSAEKERKNRFGRWMDAMNSIIGVNYASIAKYIGVTRSALSQSIYGEAGVKPETAISIMEVYRMLARQKNIPLSVTWDGFFLTSWFKGSEAVKQANEALDHVEYVASITEERDTLRKQLEMLKSDNLARDLLVAQDEIERLKKEVARLRGEAEDF